MRVVNRCAGGFWPCCSATPVTAPLNGSVLWAGFPTPSLWTNEFGVYCNGEAGRPLLVSLLLYLDRAWPREWDAETLFLDSDTDTGILVRPKCGRAVLMDQVRETCLLGRF